MRARHVIVGALVGVLALGGCSSGDGEPTTSSPSGADLPKGVAVTKGGTELAVKDDATVVLPLGGRAASAVTVTVTSIRKGDIDDFRFFSLDAETRKSSPYYVRLDVTNEGPSGLGGASLPMFARDNQDGTLPASDVVGDFAPCPDPALPETFLPGKSTSLCLVFLVPRGRWLTAVSIQPDDPADAVTWKRPRPSGSD